MIINELNELGIQNKLIEINGKVRTNNEMYSWYKALSELKAKFPRNAKVSYDKNACTNAVLVMDVWGEGKSLKIYIQTGHDTNSYTLNPGNFKSTPVAQIGCSGLSIGSNFNTPISVVAFEAN